MARNRRQQSMDRRQFLRLGASGGGLLLLDALGTRAIAGPDSSRASAVIHLHLAGGPSHLDTFDPKPDAPSDVRGEFRAIPTRVPGLFLSEHLPRLARRADRFSLIRGVSHSLRSHDLASRYVNTGIESRGGAPPAGLGALVASQFASRPGVPTFAALGRLPQTAGPLGPSCEPVAVARSADLHANRRLVDDLELAVGLVAAGSRYVGVAHSGWDTHRQNFDRLRSRLLPELDFALASLLDTLDRQGLFESTIVLVSGEFGRSPRINAGGGRDHHPSAMSVILAGGGLAAGRVIGGTDPLGAEPQDDPLSPADVASTVLAALGLPTLSTGAPIRSLIG